MLQAAAVAVPEACLIVDTAAAGGVAPEMLLASAGLGPAALDDPDARLSRAGFDCLLEEAVRLSGDTDLGLHAAERSADGHGLPTALHYALNSCPTVGDQFRMVARYARLVHADAEMTFTADDGVARIKLDLPGSGAVARRHLAERWLGATVLLARRRARAGFAPKEVWFAHPATPDTSAHERIFRAPVRFARGLDALVLRLDTLDVRVPDGDAQLQHVLDAYLATLLPEVPAPGLSQLVCRRLREASDGHLPVIRTVAAALAMSPRTLQRRLAREGTSYQHLVSEVREDLACQHLSESRLSISEIAFVLGFSDVSGFHRAFKRWTNQTPRAYRQRTRQALDVAARGRSGALGQ